MTMADVFTNDSNPITFKLESNDCKVLKHESFLSTENTPLEHINIPGTTPLDETQLYFRVIRYKNTRDNKMKTLRAYRVLLFINEDIDGYPLHYHIVIKRLADLYVETISRVFSTDVDVPDRPSSHFDKDVGYYFGKLPRNSISQEHENLTFVEFKDNLYQKHGVYVERQALIDKRTTEERKTEEGKALDEDNKERDWIAKHYRMKMEFATDYRKEQEEASSSAPSKNQSAKMKAAAVQGSLSKKKDATLSSASAAATTEEDNDEEGETRLNIHLAPWSHVWKILRNLGWSWDFGYGNSGFYYAPTFNFKREAEVVLGETKFADDDDLQSFIVKQLLTEEGEMSEDLAKHFCVKGGLREFRPTAPIVEESETGSRGDPLLLSNDEPSDHEQDDEDDDDDFETTINFEAQPDDIVQPTMEELGIDADQTKRLECGFAAFVKEVTKGVIEYQKVDAGLKQATSAVLVLFHQELGESNVTNVQNFIRDKCVPMLYGICKLFNCIYIILLFYYICCCSSEAYQSKPSSKTTSKDSRARGRRSPSFGNLTESSPQGFALRFCRSANLRRRGKNDLSVCC